MRSIVLIGRALAASALWMLALAPSARPEVVFSDGSFDPGDWSTTVIGVANGATHAESQAVTGGNPGAFRSMSHTLPTNSHVYVLHLFLAGACDPSATGGIDSLDYREDRIQFNPPFPGAAIGATPALVQAGVAYYGPDITYSQLAWQTLQLTGLRAADFTSVAATHPDFGPTGGLIHFGFTRGNTNNAGVSAIVTRHGIDNWSFTVHGPGATGVEEIVSPTVPALRVLGPNPFSGAIALRLSVPELLPVDLTIFDVRGRFVRSLRRGESPAGLSELSWNGSDAQGDRVSPGIYFVRLRAGRHSEVRKIALAW